MMILTILTFAVFANFSFSTRTDTTKEVIAQNMSDKSVNVDMILRIHGRRCDAPAGPDGQECPFLEYYWCCSHSDPWSFPSYCPKCGFQLTHIAQKCLPAYPICP